MVNPFIADDSGRLPLYIAGRASQIDDIRRIAEVHEDPRRKNILITGLRGVGKSVLLTYLNTELRKNDWYSLVLTIYEGKGRRTRDLMVYIIEELALLLDKENIDNGNNLEKIKDIYKSTNGSIETRTQVIIEYSIQQILKAGKKGLMIGFDEAQFIIDNKSIEEYPRSTLLSILTKVQGSDLPFFYSFCGLPNLLESLQESKPNVERAFGYYEPLEYLNDTDSRDLITGTLQRSHSGVNFSDDLVNRIISISAGYPYFIQYYCRELIDRGQPAQVNFGINDFEKIETKVTESLDKKYYDSRFELLSDSDKKYFQVSLSIHKPFLPKDLLEAYNKKYPEDEKTQVAIRQAIFRLTQKGILLKKKNGYDYTIPLIEQYLERKNTKKEIDF